MMILKILLAANALAGEYKFTKQVSPHELEAACRASGVDIVKTEGNSKNSTWTIFYNGDKSPASCVNNYTYQAPIDRAARIKSLKEKMDAGQDPSPAEIRQILSDIASIMGIQ